MNPKAERAMVWKLSSLNPDESGSYVFVSPGTYKIGRKDCAVCIPTDKTISRLHADFVVHQLPPQTQNFSSKAECRATLRDLSKFGTFVNKTSTGSQPVMKLPSKETNIRDGDEIIFGTMHSAFRASYVHFFFCVSSSQSDTLIAKTHSDLGAYSVQTWNSECTHVLVEDGSPVNDLVLMAVSHRKPIVSLHWLEAVLAASSPASDIPSPSRFVPTLKLPSDGSLVKVVDSETRESTFRNVVFLATSLHQYSCKENLGSLVAAAGGTLELVSKFKDSRMHQIIIIPDQAAETDIRREFKGFHHIQRIKESSLLVAILSGCKERSAFFTASSDTQSTGATVDIQEETDDDEADSVTQRDKTSAGDSTRALENDIDRVSCGARMDPVPEQNEVKRVIELDQKQSPSADEALTRVQQKRTWKNEEDAPEEYGEVNFVVGLVVRQEEQQSSPVPAHFGPNFKRFHRVGAEAGNSFHTFVPFAAVPYGETAYFGELKERMEQDKKRSEEERLADELFKKDDLKRKRTAKGESLAILKESSSSKRRK